MLVPIKLSPMTPTGISLLTLPGRAPRVRVTRLPPCIGLLIAFVLVGCTLNPTSSAPKPPAAHVSRQLPQPTDISEFKSDPIPARTHFRDFAVDQKKIKHIIQTWYPVSQDHWKHGYSHVGMADRTGTIKLQDGTLVSWMVRPGGLATLSFPDGTIVYLAKELTAWKKDAEPVD